MGKFFGLLIGLISWAAQAQFVPAAEGLKSAGLNPAIADATVKVVATYPSGQTMQCSATYISDRGHLLLASHCLEIALFGRPILEPSADHNILSLEVDGRREDWRVKLISPCRRPDIAASLPEEMSLVSIMDCEYYDLAILEPVAPRSVPACISAFSNDKAVKNLATVGFPVRTFRVREPNSMGDQAYFSKGQVVSSNSCLIEASAYPQRVGHQFSLEQALLQARTENALQTNLDAVPGNSGGVVVDLSSGHPVGVVSFSTAPVDFDPLRERCRAGGAFITELGHLRRALNVWSPASSWSEFKSEISCLKRHVH